MAHCLFSLLGCKALHTSSGALCHRLLVPGLQPSLDSELPEGRDAA